MSEVNAWLLDLGEGLRAAVGELEMVHVLPDAPTLFEIPQGPAYCREVLVWQREILPLMNLAMRISGRPITESQGLVAVTAYQEYPGSVPRYGALALGRPPVRIRVSDSQARELPESRPGWRGMAIACFEYSGLGPVPVLDLGRVFSPP